MISTASRAIGVADRLDSGQCAAAREDGHPREERLLVRVERRVAPVDRAAQRLLAGGQVARAAGEDAQAVRQPFEERLGREQFRSAPPPTR